MKIINGSDYLNVLDRKAELEVLEEVKTYLEAEGLEGAELDDAIANASESKISDLEEIISLDRIKFIANKL